ncbi:hypothetical protein JCM19239_2476 [Vibrio variabilis]|uniref:Uncharacterized protein n=1 Tax=Vibrio variabilis TaxID=990271 RepID=A0ABQ0JFH4_9VIBR|nr:hypothetical protein JCM19239_2476 [Vibrio variabilis]
MENRKVIVGYLHYGQVIFRLSQLLSERLDEIRLAILKGEYHSLETLNDAILSLSYQMAEADTKRFSLAKHLGCTERQYAKVVQRRLKGEALKRVTEIDSKIERSVHLCKHKLARQGRLMVMQHDAMEEAMGAQQLKVNV